MASVSFKHLDKTFADGSQALVDFNLDIRDGELMVMVGPSGCGKSTSLRLLAGLETVSRGELRIGGTLVNDFSPQQRNIAMVFQNYALYPHMSVRRNLAFPLQMLKLDTAEKQRRITWAAGLLQLEHLLDRTPAQLSGGQRQRVAMGRAIVREPQVFLMDEPLSNLDARLRVEIRSEIAALQHRLGITMLYVTHDQVEAMTLGDRVAVLDAGRLQQVAEPQQLYSKPANTFVAGFIGSPGMNILPAQLQHEGSKLLLEILGTRLAAGSRDEAHLKQVAERGDHGLRIGLRPEAIRVVTAEPPLLNLTLTGVEELGHERLLYFNLEQHPETQLVVRQSGTTAPAIGDRLGLRFEPESLYYFDAEGNAIYS